MDVLSWEEGYADGFDSGSEAVMQQVDGVISDEWDTDDDKVRKLRDMIERFWKELES